MIAKASPTTSREEFLAGFTPSIAFQRGEKSSGSMKIFRKPQGYPASPSVHTDEVRFRGHENLGHEARGFITLHFQNTGEGIDLNNVHRIDPFFRGKHQ